MLGISTTWLIIGLGLLLLYALVLCFVYGRGMVHPITPRTKALTVLEIVVLLLLIVVALLPTNNDVKWLRLCLLVITSTNQFITFQRRREFKNTALRILVAGIPLWVFVIVQYIVPLL